jgi:hypothetical protein
MMMIRYMQYLNVKELPTCIYECEEHVYLSVAGQKYVGHIPALCNHRQGNSDAALYTILQLLFTVLYDLQLVRIFDSFSPNQNLFVGFNVGMDGGSPNLVDFT